MCDLCKAVERGEDSVYGNFMFLGPCHGCGDLLIISMEHKVKLDPMEQQEFTDLVSDCFPGYKPRGIGMRDIKDHWHEHLIKEE